MWAISGDEIDGSFRWPPKPLLWSLCVRVAIRTTVRNKWYFVDYIYIFYNKINGLGGFGGGTALGNSVLLISLLLKEYRNCEKSYR